MTSPFESAMAFADATIDAVMGDVEGFTFTPMRAAVDLNPVSDGTRTAIPLFTAVFNDPLRIDDTTFGGRTTTEPQLHVLKSKLPQGVRSPDRITRISTGAIYQVEDVQPMDGAGLRNTLLLIRINIG